MNIRKNVELAPYTSFDVGGPAEQLIELSSSDQIKNLDSGSIATVLGFGANVLISDNGLLGLTVILKNAQCKPTVKNQTILTVDAACNWDSFVTYAIENGLWGVELMSGIPGGVGAAVAGNIAAYGQAVADCLVSVTVYDYATNKTKTLHTADLGLSYRHSNFHTQDFSTLIILDATFKLSHEKTTDLNYAGALAVATESGQDTNSLLARRHIIMETRRRAGSLLEPNGLKTAGSFFKNPVVSVDQADTLISFDETGRTKDQINKMNQQHGGSALRVSAAHVLLAAGFKRGQTWGSVRLHPSHVLKIENTGQATAQDIKNVADEIINTVKTKLDITIEPEVRFLGDFK
ncbi:TPA: UDP-N-acetylmuramate dehydrogenase [Candidatus Saccharibacteria bacterium]|nr:UDP-N-acetylmuramate dehydrogenase [Candidatus Saccharibacteria bacterium]HIO88010.1 UDP-N-acetylmuramate dehydrogenase [Candidatus Saccharibacteria bacterium]